MEKNLAINYINCTFADDEKVNWNDPRLTEGVFGKLPIRSSVRLLKNSTNNEGGRGRELLPLPYTSGPVVI